MKLRRRTLLKLSAVLGGGLAVGFYLTRGEDPPWPHADPDSLQPNAFLQITPEGRVVLQVHKAEMGQGVVTALVTLVAEELRMHPRTIGYEHAGVHPDFADPQMHVQLTAGSRSIASSYQPVREAAASLRALLLEAAAQTWDLSVEQLTLREGWVSDGAGERLPLSALVTRAQGLSLPQHIALTPASQFRYIGRYSERLDSVDKLRGATAYGIDYRQDGLLTAVLVRCPHFGGALIDFDAEQARAVRGVETIFALQNAIAIVAHGYWPAHKARQRLRVNWQRPLDRSALTSAAVLAEQRALMDLPDSNVIREDDSVPTGSIAAQLEAEYVVPYLAHATMEPPNATAIVNADGAWLRLGTQGPDMAQRAVAAALQLDPAAVVIENCHMGGGFGRRSSPEIAVEAALVAARVGRPVKLLWSREDDIRHDNYRPGMLGRLRAAIDQQGDIVRWEHRIVGASINAQVIPQALGTMLPGWVPDQVPELAGSLMEANDFASVEGAKDLPYDFANVRVEYTPWDPGIPVGYWRSVGHSHSGFIVESFVDELAHRSGEDPLGFRQRHLQAHPRHLAVLALAAERAGWGNAPAGRFQGLAVHESFGSVVAEVAEVSVAAEQITVHRVTAAVHCGQVVNPDIVRQQVEGAVVYALSAALYGEITVSELAVKQSNFDDYPLLRHHRAPRIDVHIVASDADPTGIGEPGVPPLAPAVANAVFAATGKRLRQLPLTRMAPT